jgi:hypothetical protein
MEKKIPPPKEPRPKVPTPPQEKPSIFGKEGWVKTDIFSKELKKDKYFEKLGLPREKREEIGKILSDKRIFGEIIEKSGEVSKLQSLIRELKEPWSSSDERIREIGKTIREKIGPYKAKTLADILKEIFGL